MLLIDQSFMTAVLLCRVNHNHVGGLQWIVDPNAAEGGYITLLCLMNSKHNRVIAYYLFPQMDCLKRSHRMRKNHSLLRAATKLENLANFYSVVKRLWAKRSDRL